MNKVDQKKIDGNVLADGEVTGHAHRLGSTEVFENLDGTREFNISKLTDVLTHEEHNPITLPSGHFMSGKVVEQDHFANHIRNVAD